jgi:hypothetical protein
MQYSPHSLYSSSGLGVLPLHICTGTVERSFAWAARFRRLARDYERLAETLAALHYLAFAMLMLANLTRSLTQS